MVVTTAAVAVMTTIRRRTNSDNVSGVGICSSCRRSSHWRLLQSMSRGTTQGFRTGPMWTYTLLWKLRSESYSSSGMFCLLWWQALFMKALFTKCSGSDISDLSSWLCYVNKLYITSTVELWQIVSRCPPMHSGTVLSSLALSTLAFFMVLRCQISRFHLPQH